TGTRAGAQTPRRRPRATAPASTTVLAAAAELAATTVAATAIRAAAPERSVGAALFALDPAVRRVAGRRCDSLHPEQPAGVAAENLDPILVAQRHGLHPLHGRLVGDERPVDREQDPVDAHLHHAAQQRRIGEVAAGGDVEVAAEELAEAHRLGGPGT